MELLKIRMKPAGGRIAKILLPDLILAMGWIIRTTVGESANKKSLGGYCQV
jgi:hypothetical protein